MKKILVSIIVVLSLSVGVYASDNYVMRLSPKSGEKLAVELTLDNAENTLGGSTIIEYDSNILAVKECTIAEGLRNVAAFVNPKYADNKIKLSWASSEAISYTAPLLSISFVAAAEETSSASAKVTITSAKLLNAEGEKLQCETSDIELTVAGTETDDNEADISLPEEDIPEEIIPEEEDDNSESEKKPSSSGGGIYKESSAQDEKPSEKWQNPFSDVSENDWYYSDVEYAVNNNLLKGTSDSTFSPDKLLTRAMFVTAMYRMEKAEKPTDTESVSFIDVPHDSYYADAVSWAKKEGIVNGITDTHFAPDDSITREQIASIMHRYAKYKEYDVSAGENTNILSYDDFENISKYAIEPMQYAAGMGFMKGKTASTLNPGDNATRAEIAAVLHRFIEANN